MSGRSVSHLSNHKAKLIITTAVGLMSTINKHSSLEDIKIKQNICCTCHFSCLNSDHCPVFESLQCLARGQSLIQQALEIKSSLFFFLFFFFFFCTPLKTEQALLSKFDTAIFHSAPAPDPQV